MIDDAITIEQPVIKSDTSLMDRMMFSPTERAYMQVMVNAMGTDVATRGNLRQICMGLPEPYRKAWAPAWIVKNAACRMFVDGIEIRGVFKIPVIQLGIITDEGQKASIIEKRTLFMTNRVNHVTGVRIAATGTSEKEMVRPVIAIAIDEAPIVISNKKKKKKEDIAAKLAEMTEEPLEMAAVA